MNCRRRRDVEVAVAVVVAVAVAVEVAVGEDGQYRCLRLLPLKMRLKSPLLPLLLRWLLFESMNVVVLLRGSKLPLLPLFAVEVTVGCW